MAIALPVKEIGGSLLKGVSSNEHVSSRRGKKKHQRQAISGVVAIERKRFKKKRNRLSAVDVSLLHRLTDNVGSGGATEW